MGTRCAGSVRDRVRRRGALRPGASAVPAPSQYARPTSDDPAPAPHRRPGRPGARRIARREPPDADADEIHERLRPVFAGFFELEPGEVDTAAPFDRYGMDSPSAVRLVRSWSRSSAGCRNSSPRRASIDSLAARQAVHGAVPSEHRGRLRAPVHRPLRTVHSLPPGHGPRTRRPTTRSPSSVSPGGFAPLTATWPMVGAELRDSEHLVDECPPTGSTGARCSSDPQSRAPSTAAWGSVHRRRRQFGRRLLRYDAAERPRLMDPQQRLMPDRLARGGGTGHRPRTSAQPDGCIHRAPPPTTRLAAPASVAAGKGHLVSAYGRCLMADRVSVSRWTCGAQRTRGRRVPAR